MREDQRQRLQDLQEKLADRFLLEADPDEWDGAGKAPRDMSTQERGNAYWMKKNAMATGGVLRFVTDALEKTAPAGSGGEQDADLDRVVKEAERRSQKLVKEALERAARRDAPMKRAHGW